VGLNPIEYQITLIYLGPQRVLRDRIYRCKCELKRGETPDPGQTALPPLEVIPNVVRKSEPDGDALKAAHPYGEGAPPGDNTNPPGDPVYRITITDNHAVPGGMWRASLLSSGGDVFSKLDHYQIQGWMNDVTPAIPFRVIVRKRSGGTRVDLDTDVRVLIEVKDPAEEIELHALEGQPPEKTKRREFLEEFFGKYNHARARPTRGGDNGVDLFGGLRYPSSTHPGVQGPEVIRAAPYVPPPHVDRPSGELAAVPMGQFPPARPSQQGSHKVVLDVTKVKETVGDKTVDVGIADLALTPWNPDHPPPAAVPASGDNYRFLLTLIDNKDQDVRARQEKNKGVSLSDHGRRDLPLPRAYVTGRFVVWRRLDIRLVATVNGTGPGAVDWQRVREIYGRSLIEITDPADHQPLEREQWEAALLELFPDLESNAAFKDSQRMASEFSKWLFPTLVHQRIIDSKRGLDITHQMVRRLIERACRLNTPAIEPPPTVNTKQEDSDGLFVLICRPPMPGVQIPGEYIGDRMFWMVGSGSQRLATMICAHEIGHALYLRHSYDVDFALQTREFKGSQQQGEPELIKLIWPAYPRGSRAYMRDHDQADALGCLMSQTRPLDAEPCGLCTLTLRFYNRARIQGQYLREILRALQPVQIVRVEFRPERRRVDVFGEPLDIDRGDEHYYMALSRPMSFLTEHNQNFIGRIVLTQGDGQSGARWTANPKGQLRIKPRVPPAYGVLPGVISVQPGARGTAWLSFNWNGITAKTRPFKVVV